MATQYPGHVIKRDDPDEAIVKKIQRQLNARGCGPVDPDGDFVFEGTTRGAVRGTLTSYPTSVAGNGPVLDVTFVWEVAAGRRSFTAVTSGTLDTVSGEVVMSGEVTDGWRRGCRVKEKGQLTDPSVSEYRGVIRILPARR